MGKNSYSKLEELLNILDEGVVLKQNEYDFFKELDGTISNLDNRYATKTYVSEQIAANQSDIPDTSGLQPKNDQLLETNNKTIVGAINELFQSANNGKKLIANAIGGSLNEEDAFSAMSDKIMEIRNSFAEAIENKGFETMEQEDIYLLIEKVKGIFNQCKFMKSGTETTLCDIRGSHYTSSSTFSAAASYRCLASGTVKISGYYQGKSGSFPNNPSFIVIKNNDTNEEQRFECGSKLSTDSVAYEFNDVQIAANSTITLYCYGMTTVDYNLLIRCNLL